MNFAFCEGQFLSILKEKQKNAAIKYNQKPTAIGGYDQTATMGFSTMLHLNKRQSYLWHLSRKVKQGGKKEVKASQSHK